MRLTTLHLRSRSSYGWKLLFWYVGWVAGLFENITNSAPNSVGLGLGLSLAIKRDYFKSEMIKVEKGDVRVEVW